MRVLLIELVALLMVLPVTLYAGEPTPVDLQKAKIETVPEGAFNELPIGFDALKKYTVYPTTKKISAARDNPGVAEEFNWWLTLLLKANTVPTPDFVANNLALVRARDMGDPDRIEDVAYLRYSLTPGPDSKKVVVLIAQTGGVGSSVYVTVLAPGDGDNLIPGQVDKAFAFSLLAAYVAVPDFVSEKDFDLKQHDNIFILQRRTWYEPDRMGLSVFDACFHVIMGNVRMIIGPKAVCIIFPKRSAAETIPARGVLGDKWFEIRNRQHKDGSSFFSEGRQAELKNAGSRLPKTEESGGERRKMESQFYNLFERKEGYDDAARRRAAIEALDFSAVTLPVERRQCAIRLVQLCYPEEDMAIRELCLRKARAVLDSIVAEPLAEVRATPETAKVGEEVHALVRAMLAEAAKPGGDPSVLFLYGDDYPPAALPYLARELMREGLPESVRLTLVDEMAGCKSPQAFFPLAAFLAASAEQTDRRRAVRRLEDVIKRIALKDVPAEGAGSK